MINKGMRMSGKQKGLTLIESLVVVGILLSIVAVALTLFGTVKDRLNVKNESENASFIFSQVVDLYADEETKDLTLEQAVEAGVIPKKMNRTGNVVTDSWGGKIEIEGDGETGFTLTYPRVPKGDVCVSFVKNQKKVGWDKVSIGSSGSGTEFSSLTNSELSSTCSAGSGDYLKIAFERSNG